LSGVDLFELYLILSGTLAPSNALEDVARVRAANFQQVQHWRDFEVLVAVENCALLGRSGWLITDKVRNAIVVDCSQPVHDMNGIMADVSTGEGQGWLVLR
jgi:hypothetical protein